VLFVQRQPLGEKWLGFGRTSGHQIDGAEDIVVAVRGVLSRPNGLPVGRHPRLRRDADSQFLTGLAAAAVPRGGLGTVGDDLDILQRDRGAGSGIDAVTQAVAAIANFVAGAALVRRRRHRRFDNAELANGRPPIGEKLGVGELTKLQTKRHQGNGSS
jgi:hypothetical protein